MFSHYEQFILPVISGLRAATFVFGGHTIHSRLAGINGKDQGGDTYPLCRLTKKTIHLGLVYILQSH
jgi:hypothetical protein